MYGSAATPRTENEGVTECSPSSYLDVYHSKFQRSVLKKEIVTLYRPTLVAVWAQDQGRATAPTASILAELRVSRRHGRVSPEEQGRNLGRSVTAVYMLCSLVGRSYFRLQNFLGPMSLARWVIRSLSQTLEKSERRVRHIGRGGSVHYGMLGTLLIAEPCKACRVFC